MMLLVTVLLLGIATSTGLVLVLVAALRPAPMHVTSAWRELTTAPTGTARHSGLVERIASGLQQRRYPGVRLPTADLAVLELAPTTMVRRCLHGAGIGATSGVLIAVAVATASGLPAAELALVLILAGTAFGVLLPVWRVREAAGHARHEARRALAAYLELVAGERTAGQAPGPALSEAAALGQHWLFGRLARCLAHAQRLGRTPWAAVRDLGEQLALDALTDVADLAETAADGAAVTTSLTAQAANLREASRASDRAAANAVSERLTLPSSLMLLSLLLLVLYPTAAQLLHL